MPRFQILSNAVLTELAIVRPANSVELLTVKGMGPVRVERYGHTLLEIIREGRTGDGETERQGDVRLSAVSPSPSLPVSPSPSSSHWTRRLLAAGFTVDECMAIRGLPREVVLEHSREAEEEADPEL